MSFRRRIRPARGGGYEVRLAAEERELLAALPLQLVSLLDDVGDELPGDLPDALRRLLPPAYTTDPEAERAYVSLDAPRISSITIGSRSRRCRRPPGRTALTTSSSQTGWRP